MWMMNETELQLVDYLNKNPKIIKDSLNASFFSYDYIKVLEVTIEDDSSFEIIIETYPGGRTHSCLPLPKKFSRKMKLDKINGKG